MAGSDDIAFSSREFVLRLQGQPALRAAIDRLILPDADADADGSAIAAMTELQVDRARSGKKTPEALGGVTAVLRRGLLFWEGHAEVAHFAAPFSHAEARGLARRSRGRIRRLPLPEQSARLRYDGSLRRTLLKDLQARCVHCSPLVRAALAAVALLLPTAFVEQRGELEVWVAGRPLPRVLVSALGFERSPYFVALADRVHAAGGELLGMQHGGYYGQTDPSWYEHLENQINDRYCTWGYRQTARQVPMPAVRLTQLAPPALPVRPFKPRMLLAYCANVSGSSTLARTPHYRREAELNAMLIAGVRSAQAQQSFELALRPYPRMGRDFVVGDWQRELPQVAIEPSAGRSLFEHAAAYELTLFNFPGATGFLEFIHADRPAAIFCPSGFCPVRPAARAAFQQLIDAGLYATDEASFTELVANWTREGRHWWQQPQRVAARHAFRAEFALSSPQAVDDWCRFLLEASAARA